MIDKYLDDDDDAGAGMMMDGSDKCREFSMKRRDEQLRQEIMLVHYVSTEH